jgi:hypothetical protein
MIALDTIITIVLKNCSSAFAQLHKDIIDAHTRVTSSNTKSGTSPDAPHMTEVAPPASKVDKLFKTEKPAGPPVALDRGSSESSSWVIVTAKAHEVDARYMRKCNTTQIGMTTLPGFFDELGTSPSSQCSKANIVAAYMTLSTREHLELGEATQKYQAAGVLASKYLQHKVFLGNTKLVDFLKMVKFDDQDNTDGFSVLRAFEESAKTDAELNVLSPELLAIGRELGW